MYNILVSSLVLVATFLFTWYLTKRWIPAAKYFGLVGKDLNKYGHPEVAEGGGFAVIIGLAVGLFLYLFLKACFGSVSHLTEIYAVISTVVLAGFIGFTDDILGWKKGIRQRRKVVLSSILALPLMTLVLIYPQYNSFSSWNIPLWVYALIIVPVGIIGASNAINMVAGYNGLEAGLGIIIFATLAAQAVMMRESWIAYISLIGVATLFGFLIFNWYPAKIFPGDSLTYPMGALIGALVILGNMEIFGALLFPLYFLDFILFIRARFFDHMKEVEAFGIPDKKEHLEMPYDKIYDSCHLAILIQKKIRGYATERGVVVTLYLIQVAISFIVILIANILHIL
ncbi:UDP-N-acetylmuramyl pentapeptide phosphotransferase/UDP-N-acetylglucosamine-1-phosphate transferase [Aciduliprofundum sp. MAR08-339]|uniref:MraY family glycosyltransferase n=1 Tax=Aciduliprofundum sp. (strain MAR08-339) TaxID=673860 RepID=UPI0002A4AC3D|nr:UDP-N-acetylmuramyl pentapeptide phosphotransferase/UDP-N-acetylglucosamine-1-phosphate transferase [Aciduliprofundum sp. MAR08-339]